MRNDDPWKGIEPLRKTNQINARRILGVGSPAWGLYWAVDADRHCLLILQHGVAKRPTRRLPRLRGLRVEAVPAEDGLRERLVIRLTDGVQREVFQRFCADIVEATRLAHSEEEAIERFVTRTWRWHRLLRGGRDGRLSDEEQKGLIGELRVLENHLLPVMGTADAVRCWVGPLGAPQDFQIAWIRLEAKVRAPQASTVGISSLQQLDSTGIKHLYLHATEVAEALEDSASAVTITDVASRTRDAIAARDKSVTICFEERLSATGFDWNDDYSDRRWLIGEESLFEVAEGFPRITPAMVPAGVEYVKYAIKLPKCESFRVEMTDLAQAISGEGDGR